MTAELPKKFGESGRGQEDLAPEELGPEADTLMDDVDPADFFDPEEFGYRRLQSRPGIKHRPRPWAA